MLAHRKAYRHHPFPDPCGENPTLRPLRAGTASGAKDRNIFDITLTMPHNKCFIMK